MSKTTTTVDQSSSVALPPEALNALGVESGAELDVEIVGRALVVRSVEEAQRSREFTYATVNQIRAMADEILPGSAVKRHLLWRYSLVYSATHSNDN